MVDVIFCVRLREVKDIDEVERMFLERAQQRGYELKFTDPLPTSSNIDCLEKYGFFNTYIWLKHKEFSQPVPFYVHYISKSSNKREISLIMLLAAASSIAIDEIIYPDRTDKFLEDLKYMFDAEKASYEVEGQGGCVDDLDYGYYDY